ncbi:MAG: phosphatidylinositol-3,5-bisphosphate 5-phosphatase [Cirrosporium novae-zelandiae]|nr:MAG: phosphatidylinositol-3,5-bisphosphate 5-phosphatase [Cirrosporium novae-zelandiae]
MDTNIPAPLHNPAPESLNEDLRSLVTPSPDTASSSDRPEPTFSLPVPVEATPLDLGDVSTGEEDSNIPKSFDRSGTPISILQRNRGAAYEKVGEDGISKIYKFTVYETATRFYMVGTDITETRHRILKIDRTADSGELVIDGDDIVYTKKEMHQLILAIEDGNKSTGGLKARCSSWGLLGFIRFTGAYYMLLITKRSQVAMIGGHYIYQIDGTELIPLTTTSSSRFRLDKNPEEARFVGILNNLDLSRSFYFSYSYDITHTLQYNILRERKALEAGLAQPSRHDFNEMFIWNHYLLEPAIAALKNVYDWCLPIIHGFVDQATMDVFGRPVYITIIARRSRYFAGARFLKRGANDLGYVANDVETEQIVSEMLTTSFHAPGPKLYANPCYTSYVQHRGSIPLYWTQDNTGVSPKPDIERNDPIKARERTPRESKLLKEFTTAVKYLNQFLPQEKQIIYRAWDMSRASKSRDQDVIGKLEEIAEEVMSKTSFFRNGQAEDGGLKLQNGVGRTNCIDCLDRTNAAQFVIGKRALGHQLHALGIIDNPTIKYDSDVVNLFTHMYHDHGDTIAIQYGGSHLVNTMETYRKINQWTSHSRDMVESFKRYYNNSFLDGQRQEAYNLFLGNYIFAQGQPMLWDLSTDYYLHHADPRTWAEKSQRSYINWFTPEFLAPRQMSPAVKPHGRVADKPLKFFDEYWLEYYRPAILSSFNKILSYRMNSTLRYTPFPFKTMQEFGYDLSPFHVRAGHEHDPIEKKRVKIVDDRDMDSTPQTPTEGIAIFPRQLHALSQHQPGEIYQTRSSIMKEPNPEKVLKAHISPRRPSGTPADKSLITQWTLDQFVTDSLNPSVTRMEAEEYERYIMHPLKLPLVTSEEIIPDPSPDVLGYINSISPDFVAEMQPAEEDLADYTEFLYVSENPLTVTDSDFPQKRYKAYRQWLRGKSLFKQNRTE